MEIGITHRKLIHIEQVKMIFKHVKVIYNLTNNQK